MYFHQLRCYFKKYHFFFVLMKKKTVFQISYVEILYNEPFNKIRGTAERTFYLVSEKY